MVHHFKTIQWKKRARSLKLTPFKTPSQQRWKLCPSNQYQWHRYQIHDIWWNQYTSHTPSITITITSVAILTQVAFIFTSCTLFTQRTTSGAPFRGLSTYRQEETSVWTSLHQTPGHWQRTHTQTFSTIAGTTTPSTFQVGEISQSKSQTGFQHHALNFFQDPSQEKCNSVQIDSFQDPCTFVCGHNPFVLTPFKTPVIYHQIDSFQDPIYLYTTLNCANWLLSRPQHTPWETTFKVTVLNLHERLPSSKLVISRQFHTVNPGLISRPLHHFDSVLILHGRLPCKKSILSGPSYIVNFRSLSRPLWLICYIQWMDSFQDHSEEEDKIEQAAVQF